MDEEAVGTVESFLERIATIVDIEEAIMFGSRARDDYLRHSDVDLILVSSDFDGVDWTERGKDLYLRWEGDHPLELLCYTPDEFRQKKRQIGTVRTAVDEGVSLQS